MDPIELPIEDVLDLHTFHPGEVPDLLTDYLAQCILAGIFEVRIIHGKGRGELKRRVRSALDRNPRVLGYQDAPPEAGGWGATLVRLARP